MAEDLKGWHLHVLKNNLMNLIEREKEKIKIYYTFLLNLDDNDYKEQQYDENDDDDIVGNDIVGNGDSGKSNTANSTTKSKQSREERYNSMRISLNVSE